MTKNDGTGQGSMPPSKQGSTAFQDAEPPKAGKGTGAGEGGTGPRVEDGRKTPLGGSKK